MVQVLSAKGDFCIDQFEASVGVTCPRMNPQNQVEVQENLDSNACAPVSVKGGLPWRYISQNQAAIICARAGKRLPSSAEWQQAALGTPDKAGDWQATDCNVAKNWLGAGESGPTGSAENCKSASGAYDMSGNVWEWVVETATDGVVDGKTLPIQGYVQGMNDAGLPSTAADTPSAAYNQDYLFVKNLGTRAVARGGYWGNMTQAGIYATYIVAEPGVSEGGVGFRCVK
jgi:formylglycine-generating enzyme required for sulfatase activity